MSVALHGNLRDFGIGEVFQLIGQQRKTGVLEMAGSEQRFQIAFERGAVVRAAPLGAYEDAALGDMLVRVGLLTPERLRQLEDALEDSQASLSELLLEGGDVAADEFEEIVDLVTRDTIFALLRWTKGSFHFTAQRIAAARDPARTLPAEQILMDGLRMVDEWRMLDAAATAEATVFQRVSRFEAFRAAHSSASPERLASAERIFLLIDGRLPARRVIDLSRLGTFEGARILSEMRKVGVIEPLAEEALAKRRRRRLVGELAPSRSPLALVAALLPFFFLLAMTLLAVRATQNVPPLAAGGLRPEAWQRAQLAFEARRLRNGVEAYRFARGHWPADLAALRDLSPGAVNGLSPLAARGKRPYYYAQRGETFVVLAPEH